MDKQSERRLFPSRDQSDYSSVEEIREQNNAESSLKTKVQNPSSTLLKKKTDVSRRCCGSSNGLRAIITSIVTFSVAVTIALIVQIAHGEPSVQPHGTVACDSVECTDIGIDILAKGGSAVDAAVAVVLCLGVVHPHITGLGGGGFMLVHSHHGERKTVVFDFRETAPVGALATPTVEEGPLSVGIPGQLHGLFTSHQKFGVLPWKEIVEPAAQLAADGFQISPYLAEVFNITLKSGAPGLIRGLFDTDDIKAPAANQFVRRPTLAHTLELISRHGADALYRQAIGEHLVNELQSMKSVMQVSDLHNYTTVVQEPLKIKWKGFVVQSSPAPSSGPALLMAFNLLQHLNFTYLDRHDLFKFTLAAMKTAGVKMADLGDPFLRSSVQQLTEQMLNATLDEQLLANFTQSQFNFSVSGERETRGSSVVSTDNAGLYVALISGLGSWFGSKVVTSDGLVLNDALKDFETDPSSSKNNLMEPRKRPLSSSAPVIVYDEQQVCGLRLASAAERTNLLIQPLIKKLALAQTTEDSIEAPRFDINLAQSRILLEIDRLYPIDATATAVLDFFNVQRFPVPPPFISINMAVTEEDAASIHADSRGGGSAREL